MKVKIYHYPKCSTCNSAVSLLKSKNIETEIVLYCENGLTKYDITELMKSLNISNPRDLVKRNGITYRNLGLAHKEMSNEDWIEELTTHPKLLQRPIIIHNNKAVVGKSADIINNFLKI